MPGASLTPVPSPGKTTAPKHRGPSASSTDRFLFYEGGGGAPKRVSIYTALGMIMLLWQICLKQSYKLNNLDSTNETNGVAELRRPPAAISNPQQFTAGTRGGQDPDAHPSPLFIRKLMPSKGSHSGQEPVVQIQVPYTSPQLLPVVQPNNKSRNQWSRHPAHLASSCEAAGGNRLPATQ